MRQMETRSSTTREKRPVRADTIYAQLNPAQKRAVDQIEGPVLVLAGPGTGKTQVLAARIARILEKTDTPPNAVLALTFTESAATNMRERLVQLIGSTGYYVQVETFHSFCSGIIRNFPEYFSIDRDSTPLADLERLELFQSLITNAKLLALKPINAPLFYLKDITKAISNLKREGVTVAGFAALVEAEEQSLETAKKEQEYDGKKLTPVLQHKLEKQLAKQQELAQLYASYERELRLLQRFDFDDMIALVAAALREHELLRLEMQENLHYFLVDEYQDTNSAQNQILLLLAEYWGSQANVFVVGDPNQAIFRFQGASIENMLGFRKVFPDALIVTLDIGYRCPQILSDAAGQLVSLNQLTQATHASAQLPFHQKLRSPKGDGKKIDIVTAPSQLLEAVYIAQSISQLIVDGTNPAEIAVLYRHNADETLIARTLEKWGIGYEVNGGEDVLTVPVIVQLLQLLQLIANCATDCDELLYTVLNFNWLGFSPLMVAKIAHASSTSKITISELLRSDFATFAAHDVGPTAEQQDFEKIQNFFLQLQHWQHALSNETFVAWLELVISESGLFEHIKQLANPHESLISLQTLFNQVKSLSAHNHAFSLSDFLAALETMQIHQLKLSVEDLNVTRNVVQLATVHKAKGREWEHVFVIHSIDGKWGNTTSRELLKLPDGVLSNTDISKKDRNEDERRLFYVALTRAKQQVTVTYPQTIIEANHSRTTTASLFISELQEVAPTALQQVPVEFLSQRADEFLQKLLSPQQEAAVISASESQKAFYRALLENFSLSITALNTYLRDPQEFLEKYLLKIPKAKPAVMAFGSSVHAALERMHKSQMELGAKPSFATVLSYFELALKKELLTPEHFSERLEQGERVLRRYYTEYAQETPDILTIEQSFGYGTHTTMLGSVRLTGRIDRIDWVDRGKKTVAVIDYKTGTPKTKGEIEGTTKDPERSEREEKLPEGIRGRYKRQLLFYKLLLQLDAHLPVTAVTGEFDFVEPDKQSNKMVRRSFDLLDEDVEQLKQLILEVMREITALKFLENDAKRTETSTN